ncbi:hypothetical protein RIR_jg2136.t1 [Rhizophagus irregularis DAOM 181602=DAOM 197198]|uniref:Uncharacterized protein n=1 Tax=Rhizophagus irregularis (strain DAOM 181602 / DAOM 197198 / MUCL 43194) TaxID=747089 RepID=U9UGW7_RHIID|nr:hypothetical protein RIR_jg2136.t1 [Rhizophagus irregularis DAOM 181602=DAOM 197198]
MGTEYHFSNTSPTSSDELPSKVSKPKNTDDFSSIKVKDMKIPPFDTSRYDESNEFQLSSYDCLDGLVYLDTWYCLQIERIRKMLTTIKSQNE